MRKLTLAKHFKATYALRQTKLELARQQHHSITAGLSRPLTLRIIKKKKREELPLHCGFGVVRFRPRFANTPRRNRTLSVAFILTHSRRLLLYACPLFLLLCLLVCFFFFDVVFCIPSAEDDAD